MIADLKPYPACKESGVVWLGEVPEEWEVIPLSAGFRSALKRNTGLVEDTVLSLSYGRIVVKPKEKLRGLIPESFETYQLAFPEDIIVRTTDLQNDQTSLRVGSVGTQGIITSAYLRLITRNGLVPRFGYLLLHAYDIKKVLYAYGSGLRQSLDFDELKRMPIVFPPVRDQAAIVRFLDYVNSRIQQFIVAKEQLVELLKEEKRATIHRAVTRGFESNAPAKPSGVDWPWDVPNHWTVTRVKNEFLCLNYKRRPLSSTERGSMERRYDYYGASGVIDKVTDYLFDDDLLLLAEDGANLVLRNLPLAIIARGRYWVNNHAHILRPRTGDLEFMAYLMESLDYRPYITGAAQPKLTQDRLLSMPIAVPRPDQQLEIRRELQAVTRNIDVTISVAARHTTLLREFRTRLISDVVTGKLDVREAAKRLPDDPGATDPVLDEQLDEVVA